jgi:hypothetical protein
MLRAAKFSRTPNAGADPVMRLRLGTAKFARIPNAGADPVTDAHGWRRKVCSHAKRRDGPDHKASDA